MAIYCLVCEPALPTDIKRKSNKSTITLARKTPSTVGSTSTKDFNERKFSTRAKDAARRDGRSLFEPAVPKENEAATPVVGRSGQPHNIRSQNSRDEPDANAPRLRRSTQSGRSAESARSPEPRGTEGVPRPNEPGRPTNHRPESRRPAEARAELRRAPDPRRSTEPRRGGKLRDQRTRDASSNAATPVAPSVPREPDGMVRVSKLLSEQGLCSRREADSYIARGWVFADDVRVTELGTRVLQTAILKLDGEAATMQEKRMTILMNKPIGYVSGQAEDGYRPASVLAVAEHQIDTDIERFHHEHRRGLAPAGRLDIDSTGLLVLTQDGRIAKHLIGENSEVDKEYLVRVEGALSDANLQLLNHGMSLDGEKLKPAIVRWQNEDQLNFILREGKKRQIRRMCEAVGLTVTGLKRIRIGKIKLGDLPVGKWRFLRSDESF